MRCTAAARDAWAGTTGWIRPTRMSHPAARKSSSRASQFASDQKRVSSARALLIRGAGTVADERATAISVIRLSRCARSAVTRCQYLGVAVDPLRLAGLARTSLCHLRMLIGLD